MDHNTDYIGHIDIEPALNDEEIEYLTALAGPRRHNPQASRRPTPPCNWVVCCDGCCLTWNGAEESGSMLPWLRYLISHLLKPDARAEVDPRFAGFTFDHLLSGVVAGCRRDTRELFVVRVRDNKVRKQVLRRGDPRLEDWPVLPYAAEIDRADRGLRRRRTWQRSGDDADGAQVIRLDEVRNS